MRNLKCNWVKSIDRYDIATNKKKQTAAISLKFLCPSCHRFEIFISFRFTANGCHRIEEKNSAYPKTVNHVSNRLYNEPDDVWLGESLKCQVKKKNIFIVSFYLSLVFFLFIFL